MFVTAVVEQVAKGMYPDRNGAAKAHCLELERNKVPNATEFCAWPANSPDLNIAEHLVAAIKAPHDWAPGQYSNAELKTIMTEQSDAMPQESLDRGVVSLPARARGVLHKTDGNMLPHVDY